MSTAKTKAMSGAAKKQANADIKIAPGKGKTAFGFETQVAELIKYFQMGLGNGEPIFQALDLFPIPIEIFAPDGMAVFANRAGLEMVNCKDASLLIGQYNTLKDKVCMDDLGYRDEFLKAFKGELVIIKGFPAPIQDVLDRGVIEEKPWEAATMDLIFYPIWKNDKLHFVVCVFVVRGLYYGRPDVARAKEYIDSHWQGEYDKEAVAKSANMSVTQLYRLFKQHEDMTPSEYFKKVKVDHIKEKLADKTLSIKEAFAACGEDSQGWAVKVFKEVTGISPKNYRENLK